MRERSEAWLTNSVERFILPSFAAAGSHEGLLTDQLFGHTVHTKLNVSITLQLSNRTQTLACQCPFEELLSLFLSVQKMQSTLSNSQLTEVGLCRSLQKNHKFQIQVIMTSTFICILTPGHNHCQQQC